MLKKIVSLSFVLAFYLAGNSCFAQAKLNASELNTVQKLIKEKHQLEANHELKSTYKLQIFSSRSLDEAKQTQEDFHALGHTTKSKIIYQTPNYKVWIGNYRNRIQADRALEKIKSEYPNTLIIRP